MSIQVEANTRYIIDTILKNKGWILDINNKNKNVYFEADILNIIDGDIYEKLKSSGKKPDYVLLGENKNQ